MVIIDGKNYRGIPSSEIPFGNVCRHCAFFNTPCYDRTDFTCHSDARTDGQDIVFVLDNAADEPRV